MKIAIDATTSIGKQLTGVGVYAQQLLQALHSLQPEQDWIYCYRSQRWLAALRQPRPKGVRMRPLLERYPPKADLFHGLNQRLPSGRLRRAVTTFHDLFVISGDYSTEEFRQRFTEQARDAAERSDVILAVSQFTADQVHDLLHIERSRIRVVHHGVAPVDEERALAGKRQQLVLSVGAVQKRKNYSRLVEAFTQMPKDWRLVLAGPASGFGAAEVLEKIKQSPRAKDITVTGYIAQPELETLYAKASLFAFPSLDEGFGMPILEAMAWGVPVVTSNHGAMREISGDAAFHVEATDTEELAQTLRTLAEQPGLRKEMVRRGLDHVAGFSWQSAAEKSWQAYQYVME